MDPVLVTIESTNQCINKRSGFDTGKTKVMTLVIYDEHALTEVKGRYEYICILLLETLVVVEFKVEEVRRAEASYKGTCARRGTALLKHLSQILQQSL